VGDRLFSVFGQDIVDALYWTATETKGRKREHFGVIPHLLMAIIYVCILYLNREKYFIINNYLLVLIKINNFLDLNV
jgi:hypothetical protein